MTMIISKRLIIRGEDRTVSFNSVRRNAPDTAVFELGMALNKLQTGPAAQIERVDRILLI